MIKNYKILFSLILISANLLHLASGFGANCTPGDLLEGPNCSSFYKCIDGRFFKSIMKFDCPPGTYFNLKKSLCIHDTNKQCPTSGPQPPAPYPIFGGGSQIDQKPPGTVVRPPGPPSPPISNFPPAIDGNNTICVNYEIDNSGVYDCIAPGLLPSYGDCSKFYICINTMGCIVKGYYVSCPDNYIYDSTEEICTQESNADPCPYVQDSVDVIQVLPMVTLNLENVDDFFKASAYWEYMPFLPTVSQRIVSIIPKPGEVARGGPSDNKLSMKDN